MTQSERFISENAPEKTTQKEFDAAHAEFLGFLLEMPIGAPIPLLNFELLVTRYAENTMNGENTMSGDMGEELSLGGWDINGEMFTDGPQAASALMAAWTRLARSA